MNGRRSIGRATRALALVLISFAGLISVDQPASATEYETLCAYFAYERLWSTSTDQTNGRLYWDARGCGGTKGTGIRAGSGTSKDPCLSNRGWLPKGWYNQWLTSDSYNGSAIKGRTWHVMDKRCEGGTTLRTALFIHTEQTSTNGQSCPTSGDDPFCWEGVSDYKSNGCIKVSYSSGINTTHGWYHNTGNGGASGHQSNTTTTNYLDQLYVYT